MPTLPPDEWARLYLRHHESLYPSATTEFKPFDSSADRALQRFRTAESVLAARIAGARNGDCPPPDTASLITEAESVRRCVSRYIDKYTNAHFVKLVTYESVLEEVQAILNADKFQSVNLGPEGIRYVVDSNPDGCPLGKLEVQFPILTLTSVSGNRVTNCLKVKRARGNPLSRQAHRDACRAREDRDGINMEPNRCHPHIFPPDGRPCLGAAGPMIQTSVKFGRIYDVCDTMYRLLNSYNRNDRGVPNLRQLHPLWDDERRALMNDIPANTLGRCSISGEWMDVDNSHVALLSGNRYHESILIVIDNIVARRIIQRTDGFNRDYFIGETLQFYHPIADTVRIGPYRLPRTNHFVIQCPRCNATVIVGVPACSCGTPLTDETETPNQRRARERAAEHRVQQARELEEAVQRLDEALQGEQELQAEQEAAAPDPFQGANQQFQQARPRTRAPRTRGGPPNPTQPLTNAGLPFRRPGDVPPLPNTLEAQGGPTTTTTPGTTTPPTEQTPNDDGGRNTHAFFETPQWRERLAAARNVMDIREDELPAADDAQWGNNFRQHQRADDVRRMLADFQTALRQEDT